MRTPLPTSSRTHIATTRTSLATNPRTASDARPPPASPVPRVDSLPPPPPAPPPPPPPGPGEPTHRGGPSSNTVALASAASGAAYGAVVGGPVGAVIGFVAGAILPTLLGAKPFQNARTKITNANGLRAPLIRAAAIDAAYNQAVKEEAAGDTGIMAFFWSTFPSYHPH